MSNSILSKPTAGSFASGFGYLWRGLSLITQPGVKRFVIVPLLINIGIFLLLFWIAGDYFNDLLPYLQSFLPHWLQWLGNILWIFFALLAGLFMFLTFSFFNNLVGAPFNSYLAAAVEKQLTGHAPPGSGRTVLQDIKVTLFSEVKKWGYYLLWAIPLLLLSILLSPLAPVIWFVFGAWLFSVEYLDYPLSNHGLTFVDTRRVIASQRALTLGYGCAVTLATLIPVVNFIVMPIAVAGATAMSVERFTDKSATH